MSTELVQTLLHAERQTALVTRCRPTNMQAEYERLGSLWRRGERVAPEFRYALGPDLSEVRSRLELCKRRLGNTEWRDLFAERVDELVAETQLADAVGQAHFMALARRRFSGAFAPEPAEALVREWLACGGEVEEEAAIVSHDLGNEHSLLRRMQAWVGRERLPFRIELSHDLVSLAATGEGFIVVATGRRLSPQDAERVAVHEVLGHALPRVRARAERVGLFVVGCAHGNDTQEGYAVYCEHRSGVLHAARRFELALRHVAALCVWQGASFIETMEAVLETGSELGVALRVAMRAFRGGGLAREGAYLPAFCAVKDAIRQNPENADWLAAGRLSLAAIATLRRGGYRLGSGVCRPVGLSRET